MLNNVCFIRTDGILWSFDGPYNVCFVQKPVSDSLGVKSFEEIMREKQQKRAALVNASNKKTEKSASSESKRPTAAVRNSSANVQSAPKTKQASARKYKFTPIVFDLDSKGDKNATSGVKAGQSERENLEIRADSDSSSVLGRRRVSIPGAAEVAADSAVAVTDISVTVQSSVPSKSDLTTEASPVVTDSRADNSERKITPVIKRQSSSTPLSDGSKKRRTSIDSR